MDDIDKQFETIETAEQEKNLQDAMSLEELAMRTPSEEQLGHNPFVHRSRWHSAADSMVYLFLWIAVFAAIIYLLFY